MSASLLTSGPHRLGQGFRVTFRYLAANEQGPARMESEWFPRMPSRAQLEGFMRSGAYEAARHIFLVALSRKLGGAIVCLTPDAKKGEP